ncbi:hypothetical protein FY534_00195 [Alicyclobacillus sp. TC]|uniref:CHY-type Zn-finger protein n=2 Tax=Alicyclobacillus tolerans TaxID=90970 RepID=A0ABT9LYK1_9BACL|nr:MULTISPECIES: CHY zinc finger protein [Alicyclobacillus]MDP9729231.1 putative CHY-type Zn-finger protein [Alicyclobacillus tengchongensis]QRF22279.1 hypothetical protein FY534_00195 [Alicyclobacillus sp. TC]SHK10755.1 Uncharacterized protein, contains Zn-finger domain of CHY type [Alicyclobacillus montanus]
MQYSSHNIVVKGRLVDEQTRCVHYSGPTDVIAIKFPCCQTYFPCHACHEELADHAAQIWHAHQFHEKAVLCGVCHQELTIQEYLNSHFQCPSCGASFNPGCQLHYSLYFEQE